MNTLICATCGCSLVRLGISEAQAVYFEYQSGSYAFCCRGCLEIFKQAPEKCLKETADIKVCPTCLAEKPIAMTVPVLLKGQLLYFCRCPYCFDTFDNDPQYYVDRLEGKTHFKGLFADDENACCH
jgi:YHS domain-containing protein